MNSQGERLSPEPKVPTFPFRFPSPLSSVTWKTNTGLAIRSGSRQSNMGVESHSTMSAKISDHEAIFGRQPKAAANASI